VEELVGFLVVWRVGCGRVLGFERLWWVVGVEGLWMF